jgi:hypothetical protein
MPKKTPNPLRISAGSILDLASHSLENPYISTVDAKTPKNDPAFPLSCEGMEYY